MRKTSSRLDRLEEANGERRYHQEHPPAWCVQLLPGDYHRFPSAWVGEVEIVPLAATTLLEKHRGKNRRLSPTNVATLAKAMTDASFLLTGETLIFDTDNLLINGQHRLEACIKAGVPFKTFVVVGINPDVFKLLDQHMRRTLAQVLEMTGEANSKILAGSLSCLRRFFVNGRLLSTSDGFTPFTVDDMLQGLDDFAGLRESVLFTAGLDTSKVRSRALVAADHWVFSQVNARLATDLFKHISSGTCPETEAWQPLAKLAKTLETNLKSIKRLTSKATAVFIVKCWNAIHTNAGIGQYQFGKKEGFPQISGWNYDSEGRPLRP